MTNTNQQLDVLVNYYITYSRGLCEVEQGAAKCVCNQGFVGDDCSLDDQVKHFCTST